MKTTHRTEGTQTYFIVSDLDPSYLEAVRKLEFREIDGGFARIYPANSLHLDGIYQIFARYAEEMILQMAGIRPVPWEQALLAFLHLTCNCRSANVVGWLIE